MNDVMEDVLSTGKTFTINKKYYNAYLKEKLGSFSLSFEDDDSFWIPMNKMDDDSKSLKNNGYVRISVTIMPKEM